jgi:hypothetical protein
MRLVSWNWFLYVLIGFLMGGGAVYLWYVLKEKAIKLVWYELVLTVLAFVTFLFMSQTFIASFGEGEPRAAWMTVVFMGLPLIIMTVIAVRSVQARLTSA